MTTAAAPLPQTLPERARRLVRAWQAIRPQDPSTAEDFRLLLARMGQEDLARLDETVALAVRQLGAADLQGAFRRDVMARVAHMEGLTDRGKVALRSDAFVLPMVGDCGAMQALTEHRGGFLRLLEGLSQSGRFEPSDVMLLEVPLSPEMACSAALAFDLAQNIGLAMLTDPSPQEHLFRPEERALLDRLSDRRVIPQGHGGAVLVGVRVWFGAPEHAPDEGDLLLAPHEARARTQVETEQAWHQVVLEALALAEIAPGSVSILPPATFLRGLAQVRALEQVHGVHAALEENGRRGQLTRIATINGTDGIIRCVAHGADDTVLATGPDVRFSDVHPEAQCYLETLSSEGGGQRGPRTQMRQRRRGLH